jgi:hypothetical protein
MLVAQLFGMMFIITAIDCAVVDDVVLRLAFAQVFASLTDATTFGVPFSTHLTFGFASQIA